MDRRRRTVLNANEFLWEENRRLREENRLLRRRIDSRDQSRRLLAELQERHQKLREQNAALRRRVAELTRQLKRQQQIEAGPKPASPSPQRPGSASPPFKANVRRRRKRVESRADEQPPAADLPHAQLGLNTLATGAVMRVCYRLPLRQVTDLFQKVLRQKLCAATVARQLQRMSRWLAGQHERLKLSLRLAGVVHADETSWRTNGRNGQLWTLTNDDATLYHVDRSRGGQVIEDLLGKSFGADGEQTLVSDFYSVYDRFDGPQQKCLTHLQRELKETTARRTELASHALFKRCRRLIRDMLKLKAARPTLDAATYARRVRRVERRLATLGQANWGDADADRIAGRLKKYRDKLTTFLHRPEVDGTNNAAERALRPAVVMRKITGGSRSEAGAKAWAALASVMRTAQQQGRDVLETIKTLLKAHWAGKDVSLLSELLLPTIAADTS